MVLSLFLSSVSANYGMRYLILSALTELTGFETRIQAAICTAAFLNISYLVIYQYGLCILAVNVMSGRY